MVFIPWEILQPWLEANQVPIGITLACITAVIVAIVVWWRRSSANQDVERRFMQRMAGDLEWFDVHMKDGFTRWLDACSTAYVSKHLGDTAREWMEMHQMVQDEQVSGGRGNLMEMLKTSRMDVITKAIVEVFEGYAESGTLSTAFYHMMDATKAIWIRERSGPVPETIGPLADEVKHDWAMINVDRTVLRSKKDQLALFPFLEEVPLRGLEYHMMEIIASHIVSMFQRNYIKAWVKDHDADISMKPYRLHEPHAIVARVVAILDAEAKNE